MAEYPGAKRGVAGLVCTAMLMGCVETTESPPVSSPPSTEAAVDATGTPYTTLGYANGPGAAAGQPRPVPEVGADAVYQAFVPVEHSRIDGSLDYSETHGGEDVALYGIGVGSDRVGGVIEQNLVFDIMTQALGWGNTD